MRTSMICLFSAIAGGLISTGLVRLYEPVTAQAQPGPTLQLPPNASDQPGFHPKKSEPSRPPVALPAEDFDLTPQEEINVKVYENVNRSVVNITTRSMRVDSFWLQAVPEEGTGSGLVIDQAGHVLTNYHVIEDAREVGVTLFDGETHEATFVGADPVNDLAVIRIDAPADNLYPVRMGDSARLKVGMNVFAIGNPFGLERTLTTGIISSLNRSLKIHGDRTIKSIIQIDAAVNPGNSGGPLLDSHGRVIGINTAIYSKTGQSSGVGFAIPVNLAKRVVPQLIQHGRVIRPEIGISRVYETEEGLLVAQLIPGGPAEVAGILGPQKIRERRGPFVIERMDRNAADLITEINGEPVATVDEFLGNIEMRKPGDIVTLTIIRNDQPQKITVRLGGGVVPVNQ